MFAKGQDVEVKGFGKWLGTSLLGEVIRHFNAAFYIVQLWSIIDPDYDGDYDNKPKDNEYYFKKQEEYQIVHTELVREAVTEQSGQQFEIGDVVDWNDICIMRKGIIIGKTYRKHRYLTDPDEQLTYDNQLDGEDETVEDYSYRMHPHRPWP